MRVTGRVLNLLRVELSVRMEMFFFCMAVNR